MPEGFRLGVWIFLNIIPYGSSTELYYGIPQDPVEQIQASILLQKCCFLGPPLVFGSC